MRRTTRYVALLVVGVVGLGLVGVAPSASAATPDDHATTGGFRPLLINFGGPGVSGVDFTLQADTYFSADLLKHFDVIGFDPRGTNRSDAVLCSEDLLGNRPSLVPVSPAEFDTLVTFNKKLAADCRAHTGAIFDHVDTASVSRDMDAIRAALGVRQISYYGLSYGTLLGQEYAELFPDRVRAMVIDSNEDHSMDTQQFLLTEAAASEDSFDQFVAWCDRDTTCALHGQNVVGIWDKLMREADSGTLTVPGPQVRPTWLQLVGVAFGDLYGPDWSSLAQLIAQLDSGVPSAGLTAAFAPHDNGGTAPAGLGHFPLTTLCEDWSLPVRDYQQLRQYYAESTAIAPHMRVARTIGAPRSSVWTTVIRSTIRSTGCGSGRTCRCWCSTRCTTRSRRMWERWMTPSNWASTAGW